jgi:hypothetical protein
MAPAIFRVDLVHGLAIASRYVLFFSQALLISVGNRRLLFCLQLRRSGNLWMPIGFHASWDWTQTYFYGVPDSGQTLPGHLFNGTFSGPRWLTGGTVGPEGSVLLTLLLVLFWLCASAWLGETHYPRQRALK